MMKGNENLLGGSLIVQKGDESQKDTYIDRGADMGERYVLCV